MYRNFLLIFVFLSFFAVWFSPVWAQYQTVESLQTDITTQKQQISELEDKMRRLQRGIDEQRSQSVTLSNQLSLLGSRVEQLETEIEITNGRVNQTNLEVTQTQLELAHTERGINKEKENLAAFLRTLYQLDRVDDFEIFLAHDSLSDYFNEIEVTLTLQSYVRSSISTLKDTRQQLHAKENTLKEKVASLEELKAKLEVDKDTLERQQIARAQLLAQTRESEARFQDQLKQAKAEQVAINATIQSLEKKVRERLEAEGAESLKKLAGATSMIYSVPFRGITTLFHDPDYPFRYVFEHPAIDLRAAQGTPVRAAAPGFVARARDGGMGYSYVMLIHADGLSTVYGHVSKIMVSEDEFVNQGDVIALSGATPGTPGAGRLTTGPHLHFEVRKNGIPVNPLNYIRQ